MPPYAVEGPERIDYCEPVRGVLSLDYFPEMNYDAFEKVQPSR